MNTKNCVSNCEMLAVAVLSEHAEYELGPDIVNDPFSAIFLQVILGVSKIMLCASNISHQHKTEET